MKMLDSTLDSTSTDAAAWALVSTCSTPRARLRRVDAPFEAKQGTAVPVVGSASAALVAAHVGARSTDLPGSPSRGAPV